LNLTRAPWGIPLDSVKPDHALAPRTERPVPAPRRAPREKQSSAAETGQPGVNSVTAEEKAALIKGVSQLLVNVLNNPLDSTYVLIEEVDTDNWGWGWVPALDYRRRRAAAR
jgi:4-oxalocrotonate tautomerase